MNERWVCKRCFADNEETSAACVKCGLIRGSEALADDQATWTASPQQAPGKKAGGGLLTQVLRFWWIPAAGIALAIGYVTNAQRGDDGSLSTAGNVTVTELRVADCFNAVEFSEADDAVVNDVDGVPCDEPHTFEVFAVGDYSGSEYPATQAQLDAAFTEVCLQPFAAYVGVAYADSVLYASTLTPTEEGWDEGDREFICHLHEEDLGQLSESQRGANR